MNRETCNSERHCTMRMRHGIILNKIVTTNTVFTAYTVSPSRPDGNIHDQTCAAKVTLVHARRLSFSLNHKPRLTAQIPTTPERNNEKSMSLEERDQNHHAPTRLHTMSCHTNACPRQEPLQKHLQREASESERYEQTRVTFHRRRSRTAHMHHAHPQIQPSNPDVAIAKRGGFDMHVSRTQMLRKCLRERQNFLCPVDHISFQTR